MISGLSGGAGNEGFRVNSKLKIHAHSFPPSLPSRFFQNTFALLLTLEKSFTIIAFAGARLRFLHTGFCLPELKSAGTAERDGIFATVSAAARERAQIIRRRWSVAKFRCLECKAEVEVEANDSTKRCPQCFGRYLELVYGEMKRGKSWSAKSFSVK